LHVLSYRYFLQQPFNNVLAADMLVEQDLQILWSDT